MQARSEESATNPAAKSNQIVGAILAGGSSSRMEGLPKHKLRVPTTGLSFAETIAHTLREVCGDDRVVTLSPSRILDNVPFVPDVRPGWGPLAGLEALLMSDLAETYLICACDQPLITPTLLRRLLSSHDDAPCTIFADDSGSTHPHHFPMRLHAAALPACTSLLDGGHRSVSKFLRVMRNVCAVPLQRESNERSLLRNINTPAELRALFPDQGSPASHHEQSNSTA